ncbi:hypothetical protein [Candidatus Mycobacterium methanotrophicum]|uniref:Polysaccharide biosynthesis protein C-terminal domain-containing protein n=1 Tax=Candidatus Mycobacterium methanotrophicum TaxID=2943498 RepID=A0ABY4QNI2_9MYCO|nr:hypothetical protein [Candidatus Mycobacterium methanotrophicum]UQX12191.1 hypothetical protein M5I08_07830 [Candidatus Mycobacterium methanotrophicum]
MTVAQKFGQIAVLLTLLAAAVGVLRGALGTPLLLMAGSARSDIRREGSFAFTSALLVSPIVGIVMWAVEGSGIRLPTLLIIVATPSALVKEVLRSVAIAEGRAHVATLWDSVFFAGSAALLVAAWLHLSVATTTYLIGGWTALAVLALVGLLVAVRIAPRLRQYPAWISKSWRHRARYGTDSGLQQTTAFAVLLLTAVVLSPEAAAALRGATALLAPVVIAVSANQLRVIAESKRLGMPPAQVWSSLARIALVSISATILLGLALSFLPGPVGERLVLGPTFEAARAIIPVVAFQYAIGVWLFAVAIWLRCFNRSLSALKLRACDALVVLVMALGGAVLFHTAAGVAVGIATATTFISAMTLLRFKPWATPTHPARPERRQSAPAFGAARDLVDVGGPRPLPRATSLRLGETTQVNEALIALWVFAALAVFGPAAIIRYTGIPTNASWLWSLPAIAISAARFAFLIGKGERRLFEMMFWCFTYTFLGLAPLAQLREDFWPFSVPRIDNTYVAAATLIVLVGCGAFLCGAGFDGVASVRRRRNAERTYDVVKQVFTINYPRAIVLSVIALAIDTYFLSMLGWTIFLQSRTEVVEGQSDVWGQSSTFAIMRGAAATAPLVAFLALIRFRREAKSARMLGENISSRVMGSNTVLLVVVGIVLAVVMNPVSNARYFFGTAMLAVATAFGLFATRQRFRFTACGFLVGMLLIFPLADAFRVSREATLKSTNPIESLLQGDYDSFAQLMNGYLVGARDGIVPFRQFSGVLLFWVPRTLWTTKPMDTGPYIAEGRGYFFTNLSAPLWIELYLNGSWLLLAVGMFAVGYAVHRWDTRLNAELNFYRMPGLLGCILPFYSMILLRGSLLQAASFLACVLAFAAFVSQRKKLKTRPRAPGVVPEPLPGLGMAQLRTDCVGA